MTPTAASPLRGVYLDGRSARTHDALVWSDGSDLVLRLFAAEDQSSTPPAEEPTETRVPLREVRFDPPLGTLSRVLLLPGGARFQTDDHAGVLGLERALSAPRGLHLVNAVEARPVWVVLSLVAFVVTAALFVRFGLPTAAGWAAALTPPAAMTAMDAQVLRVLDRQYLQPSRLGADRRRSAEALLTRVARGVDPQGDRSTFRYRLVLRDGGLLGANALALPGGTIVLTDGLVREARGDAELAGVLAHEVGHVAARHGVRSAYQGVGLLVFASLLTGDVNSAGTLAAAIPVLLVQNGYSREMEREADRAAATYLVRAYGSTRPLRDILTRLTAGSGDDDLSGLLSTHPATSDRLRELAAFDPPRPARR